MRIRHLHTDGFGRFNGDSIGPLEGPVTVLLGENEAGKSTLLAFIRSILFGFPSRGRDSHYPPFNGGKHGGRLVVVDDEGNERIVQRHAGARGGPVTITSPSGGTGDERALQAVLGHVSKGLFESVFTFGIQELHDLESLKEADVRGLIYSAGLGVPNLTQAERVLHGQQQELFQPRGSAQRIPQLLRQIEDIDAGLRQHAGDAAEYARLTERIQELAQEANRLEEQGAELSEALARSERFQKAWLSLIAFRHESERLTSMPAYDTFPSDAIRRLEEVNERVTQANDRLTKAQVAREAAAELVEHPPEGQTLLEDAAAIDAAVERRGSLADSLRDLPEREGELREKRQALQHSLTDLGAGWDIGKVRELDTSPLSRDQIGSHAEMLEEAARRLDEARIAAEAARREEMNAAEAEAESKKVLEATPPPVHSERDLEARRTEIFRARNLLEAHQRESQNAEDLEAQLAQEEKSAQTVPARSSRRWPMAAGLLVLAATAAAGGVAGQVEPVFAAAFTVLLAACAAAVLWGLGAPTSAPAAVNPTLRAQVDVARRRRFEAQSQCESAARRLDLQTIDGLLLDATEAELEEERSHLHRRRDLEQDLERSTRERRRRAALLEQAQGQQAEAEGWLRQKQTEWETWLASKSLPAALSPNGARDLLSRVQSVRTETIAVAELEHRVEAIRKDIQDGAALVTPLGERHGVPVQSDQPASAISAIDTLRASLEHAREQAVLRRTHEQALKDAEALLEEEGRLLSAANEQRAALLRAGETADEEEFRQRAAAVLEREACLKAIESSQHEVRAVFGPSADLEALASESDGRTPDDLADEASRLRERLKETTTALTAAREERGKATNERDRLSSEEEASKLRAERAVLIEAFREAAERWTELTLARSVLQMAREQYERDRKPAVLQDAEAIFTRLTRGNYTRLVSPTGEDNILAETDREVRRGPLELSRGTREQLHLALRFGVVLDFNRQGVRLPVIVDDALVNFDPERAAAAAEAFTELGESNQVLVFTCHPHIADLFAAQSASAQVLSIREGAVL